MKKLLLALAFLCSPVIAEEPPTDVIPRFVQMQIFCVPSIERMSDILGEKFGEAPIVMGQLNETDSFIIFVNQHNTSSTIVIAKQRKESSEACMVWSGKAEAGLAFSLNANPEFPEPKVGT